MPQQVNGKTKEPLLLHVKASALAKESNTEAWHIILLTWSSKQLRVGKFSVAAHVRAQDTKLVLSLRSEPGHNEHCPDGCITRVARRERSVQLGLPIFDFERLWVPPIVAGRPAHVHIDRRRLVDHDSTYLNIDWLVGRAWTRRYAQPSAVVSTSLFQ